MDAQSNCKERSISSVILEVTAYCILLFIVVIEEAEGRMIR